MSTNDRIWRASTDARVRWLAVQLHQDLQNRIQLADAAAAVGLSVSRLAHLFTAETGVSPALYRKNVRLDEAKSLIESSALSVKQVAALVGLGPSHLAREFRRQYGSNPRAYRLTHLTQVWTEMPCSP